MRPPRRRVRIHYRRLPDHDELFEQELIEEDDACILTFLPHAPLRTPRRVGGRVILEPGAPILWFTFPGAWYDIGRFHLRDGTFTGFYVNVLTPVRRLGPDEWETTDLFLDVWQAPDAPPRILDEDELEAARARGWIDEALAGRARREAGCLIEMAASDSFPDAVYAWTLARVNGTRTAGPV